MLSTAAAEAAAANWGLCIRLDASGSVLGITNLRKMLKNLTRMGVVFMELPHDSSREGAAFTGNLSESKFRRGPLRSRHRLKGQTDTVQILGQNLNQPPDRKPQICHQDVRSAPSGAPTGCPATSLHYLRMYCTSMRIRHPMKLCGVLSAACVPGNENEQPCHDAFLSLWPT
jgi:hypothetical protein